MNTEIKMKIITEMFPGREYTFTMPEEVHMLVMQIYDQALHVAAPLTILEIVRGLMSEFKKEIKVEEKRFNGVRAGLATRVDVESQ